jgi:hypothetical protein
MTTHADAATAELAAAADAAVPGPPETDQPQPRRPDPRVQALQRFAASISAFNIIGYLWLGFEQAPITPIACVLTSYASALLFEWVDAWANGRTPEFVGGWRRFGVFLLPAHITGLACGMLLYGNSVLWPYLFAVVVGNASKTLLRLPVRGRWRHFLNPSNTGIVVTLLLFSWVGIAPPYQFINNVHGAIAWLVPLGILMAGTMLNAKLTRKLPLIGGWVGGFAGQAVLRWLFVGHSLVGALLPMTGVAFVLFTNYMITDPGSTPSRPRAQAVFGLTAALIYGVLVVSGIVFGLFFALVITCVLRGAVLAVVAIRARPAAPNTTP